MHIGTVRAEEARVYDSYAGFHVFHAEETQKEYGSFEVFWRNAEPEQQYLCCEDCETVAAGWYWWAGFPGCLHDGEPAGPFAFSRQALEDADEWNPEFDDDEN